jgi:hypothetical protein
VGDSTARVRTSLGTPRRIRRQEINACGRSTVLTYQYPGATIQFSPDLTTKKFIVDRIEVRSSKWELSPGVRIGNTYKAVHHLLGDAQSEMMLRGNVTEAFYVTSTNDRAQFTFLKHRLWEVVWLVDPC